MKGAAGAMKDVKHRAVPEGFDSIGRAGLQPVSVTGPEVASDG